jgi:hypothetical protein
MQLQHLIFATFAIFLIPPSILSKPVSTDSPPTARWMSLMANTLAPMTIPDMVLPGTHDSGTYNLTDTIERDPDDLPEIVVQLIKILQNDFGILEPYDIIKTWAKTQKYNVYEQLLRGNRFLDVRVCWDGHTYAALRPNDVCELLRRPKFNFLFCYLRFRTEHLMMGDYTENMLADIARFMDENPGELVVLEFGAFNGMKDAQHQALIAMIRKYLGQWLWYRTWGWQPYANMIAKGRRVVAFYDAEAYVLLNQDLWSTHHMLGQDWANVDNYPAMVQVELGSLPNMTGYPTHVYKLQWVLTASARRVIDSVAETFPRYKSLHDLSRDANSHFDEFVTTNASHYRLNLLMVDWFEETDNVEQARRINRMQCNDNPIYRAPTPKNHTAPNCQDWARSGLCSTNSTISALCPLSCGLCHAPHGEAGDSCSTDSDCIYGYCHPDRRICLTDWPQAQGEACGVDAQCQSASCRGFRCGGFPVGSKCSINATCGSGTCLGGLCRGESKLLVVGDAPFCNVEPSDCENDPRGLVYVSALQCDAHLTCVGGRKAALCSTAILPFQKVTWIGNGPLCSASSCNAIGQNATMLHKSPCGAEGTTCIEGNKILCGS